MDDTRFVSSQVLVVSIVSYLAFFGIYGLRPFVPILAREELRASFLDVGLITSSFAFTGALLSVPFGLVSDVRRRRIFVIAGSSIFGIFSAFMAQVSEPIQLLMVYALAGLGVALLD